MSKSKKRKKKIKNQLLYCKKHHLEYLSFSQCPFCRRDKELRKLRRNPSLLIF